MKIFVFFKFDYLAENAIYFDLICQEYKACHVKFHMVFTLILYEIIYSPIKKKIHPISYVLIDVAFWGQKGGGG